MTGLIATIVQHVERPTGSDHVVNVHDADGKPVCWCGPYGYAEALSCKELMEKGYDPLAQHVFFTKREAA